MQEDEARPVERPLVYTAQSVRNFAQRMLICKHVFEMGYVPINPFNLWGYYLYELVDRDLVRNANNNVIKRADEVWVFGEISDGVLAEIRLARKLGKPVRYFDIKGLPGHVTEITEAQARYEEGVRR